MRKVFCAVITSLTLLGCGQSRLHADDLPAKPADGIRDDTRAFGAATHAALAAEMQQTGQALNCRIWLVASTYLTPGANLRGFARDLRRAWSGEAEAVLLAYDRSSDKQFLSFSPGLWERYSAADLASLMHESGAILLNKQRPLEDRLQQIMHGTLARLKVLEQRRRLTQQPLPGAHYRLARVYAGGLSAAMLALLVACGIRRSREAAAGAEITFPSVQVATRFAAPFGARVTHL